MYIPGEFLIWSICNFEHYSQTMKITIFAASWILDLRPQTSCLENGDLEDGNGKVGYTEFAPLSKASRTLSRGASHIYIYNSIYILIPTKHEYIYIYIYNYKKYAMSFSTSGLPCFFVYDLRFIGSFQSTRRCPTPKTRLRSLQLLSNSTPMPMA